MNTLSIKTLARLAGINCAYRRYDGNQVQASKETVIALLNGMGFPASTPRQIRESYERISATKRAAIPQLIVANPQHAPRIKLDKRVRDTSFEWRLTREDGSTLAGRAQAASPGALRYFSIPLQPQGYHVIEALGARAWLLSAPERCWTPECFADGQTGWGVSAQVYALRSRDDLGIGGFSEIAELAKASSERGASFLGLSPLHAMFSADRSKHSPYSPSNRFMLEPLFIDPRKIPGHNGMIGALIEESPEYQARLAHARESRLIDYRHVWTLLCDMLEPAWRAFCEHGDARSFVDFRTNMGAPLEDHALFEALSERFSAQGLYWSGAWPQQYQAPHTPDVEAARHEMSERVTFHAWLQWIANEQLHQAAKAASDAGMEIGLYRDLAVGADRSGSEAWRDPASILAAISIGAPPDPLGPQGQNWGLPPLDPIRLQTDGLLTFRNLVRANMRHAGAIRIDHAFQLERLFLIPNGADADAGAYVDYPFEAFLACLRIESHRAKSLVIAEDLGTAPPGFTNSIMASGLLSYRLLLFERDEHGRFLPPQSWPDQALASVTTHDLPTLQGWRRGLDIDMRDCFFEASGAERAHAIREQDTQALSDALASERLLPEIPDPQRMRNAVFRYLARTPAKLLTLQLDDIADESHQPNLPGADRGYPNWRRRQNANIENITRADGPLAQAAACMALESRGPRLHQSVLASDPPRATYRLQFNANFTFEDAEKLLPYFVQLGVSHIYASPIYASAPGSTHGYDVIDYTQINPILGGKEGFLRLSAALQSHGLKLLLDFVPNHMSRSTDAMGENPWWKDTLEWGRSSPYARVFDIDWERAGCDWKVLLPILNEPLREAIARQKIKLHFEHDEGTFYFTYETQRFPLSPNDYVETIEKSLAAISDEAAEELNVAICSYTASLHSAPAPTNTRSNELKSALREITRSHRNVTPVIKSALSIVNADASPYGRLSQLLQRQSYRLAHWRTADTDLNARRFFDVNSLIGLRVEDQRVFELVHSHVLGLITQGYVHGLRIDHIDGLAEPDAYLNRLQERTGPGFFVVVEKILGANESLPRWQVAGTTGYEAMNQLDRVFINSDNEAEFDAQYADIRADRRTIGDQIRTIKRELLQTTFMTELTTLVECALSQADTYDLTRPMLADAWMQLIAELPVYRSYLSNRNDPDRGEDRIMNALAALSQRPNPNPAIPILQDILTRPNASDSENTLRTRFEQISGPAMAKSLEDTLFYRNARFVALNEVGGDPERFGISVSEFHAHNETRLQNWPYNLAPTQTHDAKRGEDLRARLLALSWRPNVWREFYKCGSTNSAEPDANDQYFLLQNIIGAWPVNLETGEPMKSEQGFIARLQEFSTKALRESKQSSSWKTPNVDYETATHRWIERLCVNARFTECIDEHMGDLARAGFRISIARTALKLTIAGTPDIYQGCEAADFALVDPDNRRHVNFDERIASLNNAAAPSFSRQKQTLISTLLCDRLQSPALYARGAYERVSAPDGWLSFRRSLKNEALLVSVRLDPFTCAPPPAWAVEDKYWRNLLRSSAFDLAEGDCVSGAVIILKTALNDN